MNPAATHERTNEGTPPRRQSHDLLKFIYRCCRLRQGVLELSWNWWKWRSHLWSPCWELAVASPGSPVPSLCHCYPPCTSVRQGRGTAIRGCQWMMSPVGSKCSGLTPWQGARLLTVFTSTPIYTCGVAETCQ